MVQETFTQSLEGSVLGVKDLVNYARSGASVSGLSREKVLEYGELVKAYTSSCIQILEDEQVGSIIIGVRPGGAIANGRQLCGVDYGEANISVNLIRRENGKNKVILTAASGHREEAKLLQFLEKCFPSQESNRWAVSTWVSASAERYLIPGDFMQGDEVNFDRNALLEGFVMGLDRRIQAAKLDMALFTSGESNNEGLQKRINAFSRANEMLTQAIKRD